MLLGVNKLLDVSFLDRIKDPDEDSNILKISTLGHFAVKRGERVYTEDSHRSYRLWGLFKYIVTNRSQGIVPEIALQNLWPEQEYVDARRALRALIFRLRKILDTDEVSHESHILFSNGCYYWNQDVEYWLDADDFERLIARARELAKTSMLEAIELYGQGLELYRGDYLIESYFSQWVLPSRYYYYNLFIKATSEYARLLLAAGRTHQVALHCEKALAQYPYEEDLHRYYMQALLAEGKVNQAHQHYEYMAKQFYREMGVKPSQDLMDLFRSLPKGGPQNIDLNSIQDEFQEKDFSSGAMICDAATFQTLYELEQRRGERNGQSVLLVLLSLYRRGTGRGITDKDLATLQEVVANSLRKGDIISLWNHQQLLMLLPGMNLEQADQVVSRLTRKLTGLPDLGGLYFRSEIQPVLPPAVYVSD